MKLSNVKQLLSEKYHYYVKNRYSPQQQDMLQRFTQALADAGYPMNDDIVRNLAKSGLKVSGVIATDSEVVEPPTFLQPLCTTADERALYENVRGPFSYTYNGSETFLAMDFKILDDGKGWFDWSREIRKPLSEPSN